MFVFKVRNIRFDIAYPYNIELKKVLLDSDFDKYLKKDFDKIPYEIGKRNQIFAEKKVCSVLGYPVIIETSKTIWGEQRSLKGLQRVLIELMQNTTDHANGKEGWWLSVNHNNHDNKVSFIFVDYGIGIFESLKNKPKSNKWFGLFEKIEEVTLRNNSKVLKMLLDGELHRTVTGKPFRGKGLPGIAEVMRKQEQIDNLHIITNNVFADVSKEVYVELKNNFSGTFLYWEINKDNRSSKWTI